MKIQRPIIIFPIILTYVPLINLYLRNYYKVNIQELIVPSMIIFLIIVSLWLITYRMINNRAKTANITSVFFILFFSFGHFLSASVDLILRISGIDLGPLIFNNVTWKLAILMVIWVAIFVSFIYFINRINSDFKLIIQFLNVASITLLIFMVYQATQESIFTGNFLKQTKNFDYENILQRKEFITYSI